MAYNEILIPFGYVLVAVLLIWLFNSAVSAVHAAYHIGAFAIICVTTSGKTAEYISKYRPQCPTVAITRYL